MRTLFWIMLAGNIVFLAVMQQGGWMAGGGQKGQSQPALNENKIHLLGMNEIPAMQGMATASAPVVTEAGKCFEWGEFSGVDLVRAGEALEQIKLNEKPGRREVEHNSGYWVYIPPINDRAAVAQKILQLKARGVQEYFVVTEAGQWHNAISLGVFKTQEAAQNLMETLWDKEVVTAKVGERATKFKVIVFMLKDVSPEKESALMSMQKEFAGSALQPVQCVRVASS